MIIKKMTNGSVRFFEADEVTIIKQINGIAYVFDFEHIPGTVRVSNDVTGSKKGDSFDFLKTDVTEVIRQDNTRITVSTLTFNEFITELCDNFFFNVTRSNGGTIFEGDYTLFVSSTGDDLNDGLTTGTALATLERALEVMPDNTSGTVTINIGEGTFNYNVETGNIQLANKTYGQLEILGTIEEIETNTFTRDAVDRQKFTLSSAGSENYKDFLIEKTAGNLFQYYQIIEHSGTTVYIPDEDFSGGGPYAVVKLKTTIIPYKTDLGTVDFKFGSKRTSYWAYMNINLAEALHMNRHVEDDGYIINSIINFTANGYIKTYRGAINKVNVYVDSYRGIYSTYQTFIRAVGIVSTTTPGDWGLRGFTGDISNLFIKNFDVGLYLRSENEVSNIQSIKNITKMISIRDCDVALEFFETQVGFKINETPGTPYGLYCENVNTLVNLDDISDLVGLYIYIPFVNGTTPAEIITIDGVPADNDKLLDESVVTKIVLPDRNSTYLHTKQLTARSDATQAIPQMLGTDSLATAGVVIIPTPTEESNELYKIESNGNVTILKDLTYINSEAEVHLVKTGGVVDSFYFWIEISIDEGVTWNHNPRSFREQVIGLEGDGTKILELSLTDPLPAGLKFRAKAARANAVGTLSIQKPADFVLTDVTLTGVAAKLVLR